MRIVIVAIAVVMLGAIAITTDTKSASAETNIVDTTTNTARCVVTYPSDGWTHPSTWERRCSRTIRRHETPTLNSPRIQIHAVYPVAAPRLFPALPSTLPEWLEWGSLSQPWKVRYLNPEGYR